MKPIRQLVIPGLNYSLFRREWGGSAWEPNVNHLWKWEEYLGEYDDED